ncbi:MAG: gluconate 2-dehydrogenase subunit 3 family protein [Acidobacteriota bacterium]
MSDALVSRRQLLKYTAALTATSAGRQFLECWLPSAPLAAQHGHTVSSAQDSPREPYRPRFFKPHEFETVEFLSETIIPTDDQPGAREARVAHFIDFLVYSAAEFQPSLQSDWLSGLKELDRLSQSRFEMPFRKASSTQREQLLLEMSLPERDPTQTHSGYSFFKLAKDLTVEAFYTSRVGLIEVLGYQGLSYLNEFPGCTHPEHQA